MKEAYRANQTSLFRTNVPPLEKAPNRPAMTFPVNGIEVRVWADRASWGDIEWKIDVVRHYHGRDGSWTSKTFKFSDAKYVMRGIYLASRWIKKADKRANRRRIFWI